MTLIQNTATYTVVRLFVNFVCIHVAAYISHLPEYVISIPVVSVFKQVPF